LTTTKIQKGSIKRIKQRCSLCEGGCGRGGEQGYRCDTTTATRRFTVHVVCVVPDIGFVSWSDLWLCTLKHPLTRLSPSNNPRPPKHRTRAAAPAEPLSLKP